MHPQTIIAGWRISVEAARAALSEASFDHQINFNEAALRADLENIARTTLSSKILSNHKELVLFSFHCQSARASLEIKRSLSNSKSSTSCAKFLLCHSDVKNTTTDIIN